MTDTEKYQGWANYETWAWKLWIDNDHGAYDAWRERTRECWVSSGASRYLTRREKAEKELARCLQEDAEENAPELTGPYADLMTASLGEVDWDEIAVAMLDDEDLTGPEDDEDEADDE